MSDDAFKHLFPFIYIYIYKPQNFRLLLSNFGAIPFGFEKSTYCQRLRGKQTHQSTSFFEIEIKCPRLLTQHLPPTVAQESATKCENLQIYSYSCQSNRVWFKDKQRESWKWNKRGKGSSDGWRTQWRIRRQKLISSMLSVLTGQLLPDFLAWRSERVRILWDIHPLTSASLSLPSFFFASLSSSPRSHCLPLTSPALSL